MRFPALEGRVARFWFPVSQMMRLENRSEQPALEF
jgi:hypothetical protein